MSNPGTIEFIYNKLKKHGLQKYYEFTSLAWVYAVKEIKSVRFDQLQKIAVQANFDFDPTDWKQIKQYIISLKEEELQDFVKEMVAYQLEYPVNHNILLLSILD